MAGSGAKLFFVGLAGVVAGVALGIALRPDRQPLARSTARTAALEMDLARLERILGSIAARLDRIHPRGETQTSEGAIPEGDIEPGERPGGLREPADTHAARLFELARRPTEEQKLRQLVAKLAASRAPEENLGEVLTERFAFRTYREILAEFGRPTQVNAGADGTSFRYVFTNLEGERRGIGFVFTDGFVWWVSDYSTSD